MTITLSLLNETILSVCTAPKNVPTASSKTVNGKRRKVLVQNHWLFSFASNGTELVLAKRVLHAYGTVGF